MKKKIYHNAIGNKNHYSASVNTGKSQVLTVSLPILQKNKNGIFIDYHKGISKNIERL